jgi:endonuclease YncB( thermonuclease family)
MIVALIAGCQPGEVGGEPPRSGPSDAFPPGIATGTVARVNDGDSLVVDTGSGQIEVRLMGINAPESDECSGPEAAARLAGLVDEETVGVEEVGQDQFDRTLAYLWLGDLLLNLDQVANGLAIATTPEEGDARGPAIVAAEDGAFEAGLGMWSETACGASGPRPEVGVDGAASSFDPSGPDEEALEQEWVSLSSGAGVAVADWVIRDESAQHRCRLPTGALVGPGTGLSVTSADPCWSPGRSPVWNNGGDMVLLLEPSGRVAARLRYEG